jgi:hypothetical protein
MALQFSFDIVNGRCEVHNQSLILRLKTWIIIFEKAQQSSEGSSSLETRPYHYGHSDPAHKHSNRKERSCNGAHKCHISLADVQKNLGLMADGRRRMRSAAGLLSLTLLVIANISPIPLPTGSVLVV